MWPHANLIPLLLTRRITLHATAKTICTDSVGMLIKYSQIRTCFLIELNLSPSKVRGSQEKTFIYIRSHRTLFGFSRMVCKRLLIGPSSFRTKSSHRWLRPLSIWEVARFFISYVAGAASKSQAATALENHNTADFLTASRLPAATALENHKKAQKKWHVHACRLALWLRKRTI